MHPKSLGSFLVNNKMLVGGREETEGEAVRSVSFLFVLPICVTAVVRRPSFLYLLSGGSGKTARPAAGGRRMRPRPASVPSLSVPPLPEDDRIGSSALSSSSSSSPRLHPAPPPASSRPQLAPPFKSTTRGRESEGEVTQKLVT